MDLTQIRYFLALARELNFTRAAEASNVTQPALTRAIQSLEEELGGPLILRERSLTQLTELGRTMLPLLQATADAAEAVKTRAADHRRGVDEAPLRIGITDAVHASGLPRVLREVAGRVSELRLTLRRGAAPALTEALLGGELDAALLPEVGALPERLNRWPLWSEGIVVLVPEDHELASRASIPASALHGQSVVVLDAAHPVAAVMARLEREHGIHPLPQHAADGHDEAGLLVAAGMGLGLAPVGAVLPKGVVARPLAEPELTHPVVLSTAAGRPMNRAVSAFVKLVRAVRWEAGQVTAES
ncbi:DNA-binding transcriptional regulator, LysR family [Roseomonas rosea]|uniref:DNA-binding transcriptional regulator, LysR family n=1 Tax=Muricoccus roseus TaxID=198092 RepID=A0A1M6HSP7_9PROT|nr:LysR family transcriptional regulator [Roseomonas rosea]SHJ25167.1 DNA-binding transcriptional regulator, LysR family [Roseomonas rosea]